MKPEPPVVRSQWWHLPLFVVLLALGYQLLDHSERASLSYTEFREALTAGKVKEVTVSPERVSGLLAPEQPGGEPKPFAAIRVEDPDLLRELVAHQVKVTGTVPGNPWVQVGLWVLPLGLVLLMIRMQSPAGGGGGGYLSVGHSKAKVYVEQSIPVRFSDVAGVDEARAELQEVIEFLRAPERFTRMGGKIPNGILLVGPPGTGKTLLAKAVAGEANVPFFSLSGSEFVEMFVGIGAARVRDLFAQARQKAPCIIFIDELDALGKVRGSGPNAHEEREQTLNQLLVELDGFDPRAGVILMAATNRAEILDPALLRAGRFDRHVLVDRPDRAGRLAILKVHARKMPLENEKDLEFVAAMTVGAVGADLANILNEAVLLAVRRQKEQVGRAELEDAVERVVAGPERRTRVLSSAERERVAHHEMGHALAGSLLAAGQSVKKISIIPRGIGALGYTLQLPTEDRYLMTRSELESRIAVLLGGRVAEELMYGEVSTGAQDDLLKATDIARSMVKGYGMSDSLGPVTFDLERRSPLHDAGLPEPRGDYSEELARRIDQEIRGILDSQHARVTRVLSEHIELLRAGAAQLLAREVMSGEELAALVALGEETTPGPVRDAA
ncbi:MAG TPA: ATP-dependent zinc metalloprotease FtsH [Archangium sp.]|uniref:ATP-dependent zinc metalloprotease FtsH n=1 Tax=Archangium sp. TaxID=1872627 RepID=UPI002E33FB98|nr:ATP-dependent zinc metalloprotease FtsH [Archangium sp.]HEX5753446.1 ATP-dependent zinc metalloprotease FtsH [Archangium sp.]